MTDTSNILVYFMTMPERLTHINTQINAFPNSIIIESFNDINMIIPNTYVLEFKLKKKELCAYTYIKTLLTFLESNDDVCIIFEDDIIIKDELKNDINKIIDVCNQYDFIYLYRIYDKYDYKININGINFLNNISDGNSAIMWSRNGALKLINNLPFKIAKDYWIKKRISDGLFNALTTEKNYVENIGAKTENDKKSLLGSTIYDIPPKI